MSSSENTVLHHRKTIKSVQFFSSNLSVVKVCVVLIPQKAGSQQEKKRKVQRVRIKSLLDGLVPNPQAARQVQLFQTPAVLGNFLHGLVGDVGVDGHGERPQPQTLPGEVADGLVLELATGGEVDGLQTPAVVGQASQGQAVHPLAVRQAQVLELHTAQGHRHQGVAGEPHAAPHVHSQQVLVLANYWQQLVVRHPIGTVLERQVLEDFVVPQHGTKRLLGNARADL